MIVLLLGNHRWQLACHPTSAPDFATFSAADGFERSSMPAP